MQINPLPFNEIEISISTFMVYSNVNFNFQKLFNLLPVNIPDNIPLSKKKKTPVMKKIIVKKGDIWSIRHKDEFRGVMTKGIKKINDVGPNPKGHFLNQTSCYLSLGNKNVHIMIYKDKFKIAGCKIVEEAIETVKIMWEIIKPFEECVEVKEKPTFIFEKVMSNIKYNFGFNIDRKKLNNLMNDKKYSEFVHSSRYESGSNSVNIKFLANIDGIKYKCIKFDKDIEEFQLSEVDNIIYKKKKEEKITTSFLVFLSSKVIESGRNEVILRKHYEKFVSIIEENKNLIEEKIIENVSSKIEDIMK